jgi:hypothetical protein
MKPPRTSLYRAYRQLERMLFFGVPERPEQMWEREGSNESLGRVTGKPLVSGRVRSVSFDGAETLATITYDSKSGDVVVERPIPRPLQGSN